MKIEKIEDRVELNASAQGCKNDCTYYKTYSASAVKQGINQIQPGSCVKVTDAKWCKWW